MTLINLHMKLKEVNNNLVTGHDLNNSWTAAWTAGEHSANAF